MTQNGGLDVLAACCMFGVLLVLLGWVVLRHHDDPVTRSLERSSQTSSDTDDTDDDPGNDPDGNDG
ncbi:MAG TPA: hypothetical protein VG502_05585 [Flexivirga sp.]|uniref:hypothetical protein n=1 Tax=Flexivirga sp. TaxID=1962927 RepID=UPI002C854872|nr:hypothetical protein [Flexivirga sp.]HWC21751.1 hypothetical protein [Flexivirga sp.]